MALEQIHASCDHCGNRFVAMPTRTFLGFQRLICPKCSGKTIYPLTTGFRITYWILAALMLLFIANAFNSGGYAYPGGVGLAILFAIYKDWRLRAKVQDIDVVHSSSGLTPNFEQTPANRQHCASCNHSIPTSSKFCPECGFKVIAEKSNAALEPTRTPEELMVAFGISHDGSKYCYETYKYDRLQDAINYASLQKSRVKPFKCK